MKKGVIDCEFNAGFFFGGMIELPAGEESIIIFIIINFIKTKNKQAIPSHLHHAGLRQPAWAPSNVWALNTQAWPGRFKPGFGFFPF